MARGKKTANHGNGDLGFEVELFNAAGKQHGNMKPTDYRSLFQEAKSTNGASS